MFFREIFSECIFKMTILRGGGGDKYIGNQVKKKRGFLLFLQREIKIIKKKERNSLLFLEGRAFKVKVSVRLEPKNVFLIYFIITTCQEKYIILSK